METWEFYYDLYEFNILKWLGLRISIFENKIITFLIEIIDKVEWFWPDSSLA